MDLQVGDLCFCQCRGKESWPGKILKVVSRGFHVKLFGSGQLSRIGRGNVWKVCSDTLARFINVKSMKDCSFQLGVKIMLKEYREIEDLKNMVDQTFTDKETYMEYLGLSKDTIDEVAVAVVNPTVASEVISHVVNPVKGVPLDHLQPLAGEGEDEFEANKIIELEPAANPEGVEEERTELNLDKQTEKDKNCEFYDLSAMIDDALNEIRKKMNLPPPLVDNSHSNTEQAAKKVKILKVKRSSNKSLQESRKITNKLFFEKIVSLETGGFTCKLCNSGFGLRLAAKSHAVTCGEGKAKHFRKKKILECLQCNDKFEGKIKLNKHFAQRHIE